jgi:predicted lipoprotein with Yx(FWY)xxD motif/plastocyanin
MDPSAGRGTGDDRSPMMRPSPSTTARVGGLLAAAGLLLAACAAGTTPSPASGSPAASAAPSGAAASSMADAVTVAQASVGAYLAGPDGRALYVFEKDSGGQSACTGQCATTWPPFTLPSGATVAPASGVGGTFATITRQDGSSQVTYDGAPLYYYSGDQKAGDINGQGLNGLWFLETPAGTPAGSAASPSPAGGGYGGYAGGSAGSSSPAGSTGAAAASASIVDFGFQPGTITVKVGATVTWTNTGAASHTVTADDASFDSGSLATGRTFQHTFTAAGTYSFHCKIHPSMTGTVVVTS